jgi:hypothetical protein
MTSKRASQEQHLIEAGNAPQNASQLSFHVADNTIMSFYEGDVSHSASFRPSAT